MDPIMFTVWIRNDVTGEAAQFKGQGESVPAAFKDGWDNANEAFGKDTGGGMISEARFAVVLPDGERVFRTPKDFASRKAYDAKSEFKPAPTCEGDAAKPYTGPFRVFDKKKASPAK